MRQADRQQIVRKIKKWILDSPIVLDQQVAEELVEGFASDDHYDAFVGLLSMMAVVSGKLDSWPTMMGVNPFRLVNKLWDNNV